MPRSPAHWPADIAACWILRERKGPERGEERKGESRGAEGYGDVYTKVNSEQFIALELKTSANEEDI